MKEIAKCSSEKELSDFIISYFKEKVMRLTIYKELENDDDTGTKFAGKCYEGCPPSYQSKIYQRLSKILKRFSNKAVYLHGKKLLLND